MEQRSMKITTPDNSTEMANAVHAVFGRHDMHLENRVCAIARRVTETQIITWHFCSDTFDERPIGFWIPDVPGPLAVVQEGNGFECPNMDREALGLAVTLMAINHQVWELHGRGQPFEGLVQTQDNLTDWMYENNPHAGEVAAFLD
jgi:hypothetical protein